MRQVQNLLLLAIKGIQSQVWSNGRVQSSSIIVLDNRGFPYYLSKKRSRRGDFCMRGVYIPFSLALQRDLNHKCVAINRYKVLQYLH